MIDTRDPRAFAAGHDEGALNLQWGWNQLSGRVQSYLPDHSAPVAIRAESPARAEKAKKLLEDHGYASVEILTGEPGTATVALITVAELAARIDAGTAPTIIDVRTQREWDKGVIEGAILVEQDKAPGLLPDLDPTKEYAVICAGGYRSGQFVSLLQGAGFTNVHNVIDGMSAWYKRD